MPHGIYPIKWAQNKILNGRVGEPYRPTNFFDGEAFYLAWCCDCARDRSMFEGYPIDECDDDQRCQILGDSFHGNVKEWVIDQHGQPCCNSYVEAGQPIPEPKCELTIDMFGSQP